MSDIPMTLFTHGTFSDFKSGEIDVEIRYGDGSWPDFSVEKIADEFIFPVCSPSLLAGKSPLSDVNDIKNFELIHDRMVMVGRIGWKKQAEIPTEPKKACITITRTWCSSPQLPVTVLL